MTVEMKVSYCMHIFPFLYFLDLSSHMGMNFRLPSLDCSGKYHRKLEEILV